MKREFNIRNKHLRTSFICLLTLLLSGCSWIFYDRYQVFDDEFKNSKKSITRMELSPLEPRTEIGNANIIFEREYSHQIDIVKAYCVIDRSSSSFRAENRGFLKINDDTHEITLENIVSEQKMRTETSASTFTKTDSTTVSSGSSIDSDTRIWIDDKFIFILSEDMINKIKTSNNLILRFYFGPIPATFRIKSGDLRLLKKTLNN